MIAPSNRAHHRPPGSRVVAATSPVVPAPAPDPDPDPDADPDPDPCAIRPARRHADPVQPPAHPDGQRLLLAERQRSRPAALPDRSRPPPGGRLRAGSDAPRPAARRDVRQHGRGGARGAGERARRRQAVQGAPAHRRTAPPRRDTHRCAAGDGPATGRVLPVTGGTFSWRSIAGTHFRSSHSWGIAIDLDTKRADYWRYQTANPDGPFKWKNRYPQAIVDAFEAEGFIWGGRWYHFDTMGSSNTARSCSIPTVAYRG